MSQLLVEKYRPKVLDDVIVDADTLAKFKSYIDEKSIPHLLFSGTAGLGKTTVAKILANSITEDVLYINASDETGIDVVRNRVKDFCYTASFGGGIKIVILDEVDGMSANAMRMLRNTTEEFANTCRFILTCNYIADVIPPIRSRCQEYEFGTPSKQDIAKKCFKILKEEGAACTSDECKEGIKNLVISCYPDIRKTINTLEKCIIDGVFKFSEDKIDSGVEDRFFELIKAGDIKTIRKELLGAGADYKVLYKLLFERAKKLASNESVIVAIMLNTADFMSKHSIVFDQEMNFVACLLSIWKLMKSE